LEAAPVLAKPIEIEASDLSYVRGDRVIMDGLSCTFPRGRISVLAGPSGSGKTTLLRMIACLIQPDTGVLRIDGGTDLATMDGAAVRAFRRRVGMLFQGGALLDSMNIFDNVALPLREHSELSEAEIRDEVHGVFESVGLEAVDALLPGQLSGGMVKRAGLARALIEKPDLLLCDEPFSGLDPPTVRRIEELLEELNERVGATMLITSHHTHSTQRVADHLVLLLEGRAVSGPVESLMANDPRVADFFAEPEPRARHRRAP
jgi:phospholipid/cholesterol/gamma-HCH transport system ATP-binding protein